MTLTAALLLGLDESSRFGGPSRALLPIAGSTAVGRLVDLCVSRELEPVAVVVGPHHGPIARELRRRPMVLVESDRWYEGSTASVQTGFQAIPPDRDVLFWPIEHPYASGSTVDALLRARDEDALAVWFVPTYEGREGYPLLWRAQVRAAVLDLRPDAPLGSLVPEFGVQVRRVGVEDPGVVTNGFH